MPIGGGVTTFGGLGGKPLLGGNNFQIQRNAQFLKEQACGPASTSRTTRISDCAQYCC
jgi:hypothetical protein